MGESSRRPALPHRLREPATPSLRPTASARLGMGATADRPRANAPRTSFCVDHQALLQRLEHLDLGASLRRRRLEPVRRRVGQRRILRRLRSRVRSAVAALKRRQSCAAAQKPLDECDRKFKTTFLSVGCQRGLSSVCPPKRNSPTEKDTQLFGDLNFFRSAHCPRWQASRHLPNLGRFRQEKASVRSRHGSRKG